MNYIIERVKWVVDNAKHIMIDEDAIFEFSSNYSPKEKSWNESLPFPKKEFNTEEEIAFYFVLNSLAFSTWGDKKWAIEYNKSEIKRGSFTLIASIYRAIDNGVDILNPSFLSEISLSEVKEILSGVNEIPMIEQRHKNLVELGSVICSKFDGSFMKIIEESKYDVKELLHILTSEFSLFADESKYEGQKVYFYKLAQLLINDIVKILGVDKFSNYDLLTALADYKIPYILHYFKILRYDPSLTSKLEKGEELVSGSEEEIEIRAATIMAVNLIYFVLKEKKPNITVNEVNDYLWLKASEVPNNALPHHKTRSRFY